MGALRFVYPTSIYYLPFNVVNLTGIIFPSGSHAPHGNQMTNQEVR